jgi:hypothetical protein
MPHLKQPRRERMCSTLSNSTVYFVTSKEQEY